MAASTARCSQPEKFLCAFRIAKAAHASLAFTCRLVAVFGPVVQSRCSFDEHVLYVHKFRNLGFCGRMAAQLIGDDLARHRAGTQHTLEEAFSCGFVVPLLNKNVEFGSMFVIVRNEQACGGRIDHIFLPFTREGSSQRKFAINCANSPAAWHGIPTSRAFTRSATLFHGLGKSFMASARLRCRSVGHAPAFAKPLNESGSFRRRDGVGRCAKVCCQGGADA